MTSDRFLSFAGSLLIASLPLWVATTVACGDSTNDGGTGGGGSSGAGAGSGGSSTSGGAGTTGGGSKASGGAGTNAGGAGGSSSTGGGGTSTGGGGTGGSGPKGGTSAGGGGGGGPAVEPGAPCTTNCPKGTVQSCFENCPYGACDEGGLFADVACSTYYPKPISDQTVFCAKGQTASYCFTALDKLLNDYVVSCNAGTPTVTACPTGCGVDDKYVATCN
jgi:hypothetical protein